MSKPYEKQERVQEFCGTGIEPLGDGDFRVEFLVSGMTRMGDKYYPERTLEGAVGAFDGAKMYFNHATPTEVKSGVRDVRQWGATIKPGTVHCAETFVEGQQRKALRAVCHAHTQEALAILNDPVAKAAIGLSHDSLITTSAGKINNKPTRIVEAITHNFSVDFVPTGNANGRVLEAAPDHEEVPDMALESLTLEELRSARPELVQQIAQEAAKDAKPAPAGLSIEQVQEAVTAAVKPMQDKLASLETQRATEASLELQRGIVRNLLSGDAGAGLSEVSKSRVMELFAGSVIEADKLSERVSEAANAERKYVGEVLSANGVRTAVVGLGGSTGANAEQAQEAYKADFRTRCKQQGMSEKEIDALLAVK